MFFGEIVERDPIEYLEDSEDVDETAPYRQYAVSWRQEKPTFDTVVIFHRPTAEVFATQYFIGDMEPVGNVTMTTPELKASFKGRGDFYKLSHNILALVVSNIADEDDFTFADSLSEVLQEAKSQVFIVTSELLSKFKCDIKDIGEISEGFLRLLQTDVSQPPQLSINVPVLEPKNFIVGVSAGVLNWCCVNKMKANLVVCYSFDSCGFVDSRTIAPLLQLLKCEPLNQVPLINNLLKSKKPVACKDTGNLYL